MNRNFSNTKHFFLKSAGLYIFFVRFEVLTAAFMKIQVYRVVTHCKLRNSYRRFGEAGSVYLEVPATFPFLHICTELTADTLLTN